ncbi:AsmA family protein [Noviherbaspirillum cavernae]|uniref:AsmA family protein n=1 Tax=Noviherbaspirillum cavernae TaxID=2320862 RepID=A0A418WWE0_9BURK|nr:AsmA family protein [Noviherbaspirillum cavernae]RJF96968.1 AsmA family protein [Noviherbaspirillum cavernae]
MRRSVKITLGSLLVVLMLIACGLVVLAAFDWNRIKPYINERASEAAGRPFAINGDLSLSWERPVRPLTGERRLLPWPHLRAHDVTLANPDWATTGPMMARVQQVDFTIELLPLLRKIINVNSLLLTEPQLVLEQDKERRNNWTLPKREDESEWQIALHDLALTRGTVRLLDAVKRADITARIDTLAEGEHPGGIRWQLDGKFNGERLTGSGVAGALLSLQRHDVRYPVEAELKIGNTEITIDGTFTDPARFSELDVDARVLGASMAQLFPLIGVLLPETPKFSTAGRLVGRIGGGNTHLRYEKFTGKVGSSDLRGTLEYVQQKPRSLLRGEVVSNYLNLNDLRVLLGTDSPEEQKKRGATFKQPPGKVLPVEPFRTDRWTGIDVQVQFTGAKIVRATELPIDNLVARIQLDNGVLAMRPLNFGVAGGRLTSDLEINGRGKPVKAQMNIAARGLHLKRLFPKVEAMQASLGQINGNARLTATGDSFAALLASSNGEVKALISQGSISKLILEAMGLNVGSVVIATLFGDRQVSINCMAADFSVSDGLMQTRTFIVDTEDAKIGVDGQIDLAKEALNLKIEPQSKGVRLLSLRSPLYVTGTFKQPEVGVDKGAVALRAGAAAVLGAVAAPLASLLALINPGPEEDSPCAQLLAQAQEKPVAPPPGKTAPGAQR